MFFSRHVTGDKAKQDKKGNKYNSGIKAKNDIQGHC
jgi:hypothetical protein